MAKTKRKASPKRAGSLAGYKGLHRPDSRKGEVHRAYDEQDPEEAARLASALGLSPRTFPAWERSFRRQADPAPRTAKPARAPVNVSLDVELIAAAKELEVNLSRAAEIGIASEVARARGERWLRENRAAIESSNKFIEAHGLPLARHRMF